MKRISRRNFLKVAGVGAAALSLAACGGAASSTAPSTASSAASAAAEDVTIKVVQSPGQLPGQIVITFFFRKSQYGIYYFLKFIVFVPPGQLLQKFFIHIVPCIMPKQSEISNHPGKSFTGNSAATTLQLVFNILYNQHLSCRPR